MYTHIIACVLIKIPWSTAIQVVAWALPNFLDIPCSGLDCLLGADIGRTLDIGTSGTRCGFRYQAC